MTWEERRAWHLIRPLVYYLRENLVAPDWAKGAEVLDFSAGLGDLAEYLSDAGATRVVATRPEPEVPNRDGAIEWRGNIAAGSVATSFAADSFDLAVARMVFQFPTWDGDRADPDSMAEEFATVLRPGGRLVAAFHEFVSFEDVPARVAPPSVDELLSGDRQARLGEVVRYLGLPPREGPFGETGFGLKVPMLVTTFQSRGFSIEFADHPEPFTMPLDLDAYGDAELVELGEKVMRVKERYLSDPDQSHYDRPAAVREMLLELEPMFEFAAWPIVRIVARLAG